MIENGFSHEELSGMEETEFVFWLQERIALDEAKAEAEKQAAQQ